MTKVSGRSAGRKGVFAEPRFVWVFQCSSRPALHAATLDRTGRTLPSALCAGGGAWNPSGGQMVVGPTDRSSLAVDVQALKTGIAKNGYYLWNVDAERLSERLRLI